MIRSLYSAVSGISVNQQSMDVIGNNIANVNTIGYKQGRAVFQDMLSQTLQAGKAPSDARGGVNPRQVGTGAYLVSVDNIFEQGTVKATSRTHDLAIEGNGFFVVRGEGDDKYYTRAGDFNFDKTGYLATPSGYRVQGWMSDPVTGKISYNTVTSDIFVSEAHNTMQAKSTSNIDFAGILDTRATASSYEFNTLLTQASGTQDIFSMVGYKGEKDDLGLNKGDTVRIKAHATGITDMASIANSSEATINLDSTSTVDFTMNGYKYNFKYSPTSTGLPNDNKFKTLGELADELNNIFFNDAATYGTTEAVIEDGRLKIKGGSASSFEISSVSSTSTVLLGSLESLKGTYYNSTEKSSGELYYQKDVVAGEAFNNLESLAGVVEDTILGPVVSTGFSATYMENNFGLRNGDSVTMNVYIDGSATATPITVTYKEDPKNLQPGEFHTINDYATALQTQLAAAGVDVAVNVYGNSFDFQYKGTGSLEFGDTSTWRIVNLATELNASPYLEGVMNGISGTVLSNKQTVSIDDISGKGRISYANTGTTSVTGLSIKKTVQDSNFDNNVLYKQPADVVANGGYVISQQFLTQATEDTLMLDLFNNQGASCNFVEGNFVSFSATIGDNTPTANNSFSVSSSSNLQNMMDAMENYLGLGASFNTKENVSLVNGQIEVVGEKGEANNISSLKITGYPESTTANFNNAVGQPTQKDVAEKGIFTTEMPVYDGQGNKHLVKFEFSLYNEEKNEWAMRISTDEADTTVKLNGATTNELIMSFKADGTPSMFYDNKSNPPHVISNPTLDLTPSNGSNTVSNVAIHLGTPGKYDGLVLSAANMSISLSEQDGYPLGILDELMFNPAGEIIGYYTNGNIRTVGQIALATFQNNQGLMKVGDTMFAETGNSGSAAIGTPLSGSRGQIASSALEQSNVDLSSEFVNMIVTQRGFQANSRVVTTSDEMIQELLNLKR